ncbi:hypothetical protein ACIRPX_39730 [Streptomyces sp. NPDC101225]
MSEQQTGHSAFAAWRQGTPWPAAVRSVMVGTAVVVVVAALWATAVGR